VGVTLSRGSHIRRIVTVTARVGAFGGIAAATICGLTVGTLSLLVDESPELAEYVTLVGAVGGAGFAFGACISSAMYWLLLRQVPPLRAALETSSVGAIAFMLAGITGGGMISSVAIGSTFALFAAARLKRVFDQRLEWNSVGAPPEEELKPPAAGDDERVD
jgi:uncharacterized BrkB/YihY/UPF0761 family membrane protein